MKLNRVCKADGTVYSDSGGPVGDPRRDCPVCGSAAWYTYPGWPVARNLLTTGER